MRVLLVNPPTLTGMKFIREGRCEQRLDSFQYVMVPISLPMTAGALEAQGHEVRIKDCIAQEITVEALCEEVKQFHPQLILFNMSTATYASDIQVIEKVREVSRAHFTVIGNHATSLPHEVLEASKLDSVIRREPEDTTCDLARVLEKKGDLKQVLGITYKTAEGSIVHNPDRPLRENLDELPFAARHLLENQRYTLPVINEPYTLIITGRGCPHSCIYCTAYQYYGKKLRLRSAANVVDEMEECLEKHGLRNFTFWSDTFNQNRRHVMEICAEINRRGLSSKIRWTANSRVDCVDPEVLKAMKESGCLGVSYGVESGSDEVLRRAKKGATVEQARQAIAWTKQAGIEVLCHFIFGLPGETRETIEETIQFALETDPDYAQFYCAVPFPKTELEEIVHREGWRVAEDYSCYELNQVVYETPQLPRRELEAARIRAYRRFYLRPGYLWKRMKRMHTVRDFVTTVHQGGRFLKSWIMARGTALQHG